MPSDFEIALRLQRELDAELGSPEPVHFENPVVARQKRAAPDDLNATQNLVHPEWETLDPTPDVQALFGAFDTKFFQGKLRCVQLEWSKKMYQCAGICYYRRNRMGTSITIRLSEPLLKLRQRKDLVETMLHEMIHAYLFVLNIREGNGGHGPNFKRIMISINQTAGTNITVYHSFHDEVNMYKTHVWRCNGICQHRKPFFGYVRRTCNRAPGANDQWWAQHQQTCGGYFAKISGPEPQAKASRSKSSSDKDITKKRPSIPAGVQRIDDPKWGLNRPAAKAASSVRTITAPPRNQTTTSAPPPPVHRPSSSGNLRNVHGFRDLNTSGSDTENVQPGPSRPTIGGNLRNVIGFKDLNGTTAVKKAHPNIQEFTTGGHKLGSPTATSVGASSTVPVIDRVRDVWSARHKENAPKRPRLNSPTSSWKLVDDDDDAVLIQEVKHDVVNVSDDSDDDGDRRIFPVNPAHIKIDPDERQRRIKTEIMNDSNDFDENDIILIDDDFDDDMPDTELADTSIIDDIFGTDTLLSGFKEVNDAMPGQPSNEEIISCPICTERMCRDELEEHLNGCQGIKIVITRKKTVTKGSVSSLFRTPRREPKPDICPDDEQADRQILADCGYTAEEIEAALAGRAKNHQRLREQQRADAEQSDRPRQTQRQKADSERLKLLSVKQEARTNRHLTNGSSSTSVAVPESAEEMAECPACTARIALARINDHLDVCLSMSAIETGSFDSD